MNYLSLLQKLTLTLINKKAFLMLREKKLLFSFFLILTFISILKLYDNASNLDAWEYGEWLINYENGFIRRGFFGELILEFSKISKLNIQNSFLLIISAVLILYFYKSFLLIKNLQFNIINIFLIFSPIFFFFFFLVNGVGIRKEIILYLYYLFFLLELNKKNSNNSLINSYLFLFPFLFLVHESFFFFLPYFFLPIIFIKKNSKEKINTIIITLAVSLAVMVLLYTFKGSYEHTLIICESLGDYAPVECKDWGPTYALQHDLLKDQTNKDMLFFYLEASIKSWIGYLLYIAYSFVPVILFILLGNFKRKIRFKFFFLVPFFWSLPLFHVAEDWSRWFSIHYHMISFLLIFLNINKIYTFSFSNKIKKINDYFINKKLILVIALFIYSTFLTHEEYFAKDVNLEISYIKIFNKLD